MNALFVIASYLVNLLLLFLPEQIFGTNPDKLDMRFIVCAIYLLLGMALIAMCFNLMQVRRRRFR